MRMTVKFETIIWILTVALFSSFTIFSLTGGASVLFTITFLILGIILLNGKTGQIRFKIGRFQMFVIPFAIYCCLTSIWANNSDAALDAGMAIVKIMLCLTVLYSYYNKPDGVGLLIKAVMWSGYIIVIYSYYSAGIMAIIDAVTSGNMLRDSYANVNNIGIDAAIAIMLSCYFMIKEKRIMLLYIILDALAIILVASTGSRKSLIFAIVGIIGVILVENATKDMVKTVLKWIVLMGMILFFLILILSLPVFDAIKERMLGLLALFFSNIGEIDHSTWLRQEYIRVGMEQFKHTPLLGMGMDNTYNLTMQIGNRETYLHNNYVEILAGGGIIGFWLFYANYVYLLIVMWRRRKTNNEYIKICIIWMLLLLVMQYGMVTYYSKKTYFYLMIFYILTEQLGKRGQDEVEKVY